MSSGSLPDRECRTQQVASRKALADPSAAPKRPRPHPSVASLVGSVDRGDGGQLCGDRLVIFDDAQSATKGDQQPIHGRNLGDDLATLDLADLCLLHAGRVPFPG
ncbi:MAG: hypothetical protein ACLP1Q_20800 [Solirubrobacteraceae bacterium]